MSTLGEPLKILIAGDGTVRKTSILVQYMEGKFMTEEYKATVLEQNLATINYNRQNYPVELIDTGGQEDFENIRKHYYPIADVFLLCLDVTNRASVTNITSKVSDIPTSSEYFVSTFKGEM